MRYLQHAPAYCGSVTFVHVYSELILQPPNDCNLSPITMPYPRARTRHLIARFTSTYTAYRCPAHKQTSILDISPPVRRPSDVASSRILRNIPQICRGGAKNLVEEAKLSRKEHKLQRFLALLPPSRHALRRHRVIHVRGDGRPE